MTLLFAQENDKDLKRHLRDQLYELELETGAVTSSLVHSKAKWEKRAVMPINEKIEAEGILA